MALESPLVTSPGNVMSTFSPYTDFSMSPDSPSMPKSPRYQSLNARHSTGSSNLRPKYFENGLYPGPHLASPSDLVGPSPVTSNGTETTDIEDDVSEEVEAEKSETTLEPPQPTGSADSSLTALNTGSTIRQRANSEDEPSSVIHAPEGYGDFGNVTNTNPAQSPPIVERSTPIPHGQSESERKSPTLLRVDMEQGEKTIVSSPVSPPPISTNVPPAKFGIENATPRAHTRQEVESLVSETRSVRSSRSSSLENIPEDQAETEDDYDTNTVLNSGNEVAHLKTALHECWTLCNTLASLSSIHRERIFSYAGSENTHEQAWKCCWKLCQKLYDNRDEEHDFQVRPTLEMCRDFCQALFDGRTRTDELADSVLRVSFELNNHLYNTHDRNLPEAFRERTLDFYITLCHRLMKLRSGLAEETDSLLRACWSLAEMLFSLRQNRREGKAADEELIGSAVQACWELCDLFREGWTQVRPERGTPRPSQTTFSQAFDQMSRSSHQSSSLASVPERNEPRPYLPETPTTEFEDTPISPEESSPSIPNILVLGTENNRATNARWSSASSVLSGFSQSSQKSSSTATTTTGPEDINLTRLKVLILKAAMNVGFQHPISTSPTSSLPLQTFVKTLPTGSFGSLPWHASLLAAYKSLVLGDPTFKRVSSLPPQGKRATASEVAKSVGWMMRSGQYPFLRDLFRLVFGFHVDEAEKRKSVSITV